MSDDKQDEHKLIGLHIGVKDDAADKKGWIYYDLGKIALRSLEALKIAVLAIEQITTKEILIHSLDIADFYEYLGDALGVENGEQGVLSEPGAMFSLQDEIQGVMDLVSIARRIARRPRGE